MSELISKENLIKAIVNTPTNEQANTMQGYLDGIATRQLEIIDIINSLQTVSEQEIRDKAIEDYQKECAKFILNKRNEFVNKIQRRANDRMREAIVAETRTVSCYKTGIKEGLEEAVEVFDEIAEQMKEVGVMAKLTIGEVLKILEEERDKTGVTDENYSPDDCFACGEFCGLDYAIRLIKDNLLEKVNK